MNLGKTVTYAGDVLDCVKQGKGSYKYPGGVYTYEGPWVDGKKHGSGGEFTLLGGATYTGDFTNGEITGKGTKTWADGRSYSGDFVNGEMNGRGNWTSKDSEEVYEGEFKDNRREGHGYCRMKNGDSYSGDFSSHRFHGTGSYHRENCFVIASNFEKGVAHGAGNIKWHKAGSYEGDMVNGNMHGSGKFTAFDGSFSYEGEFLLNRPSYSVDKLHLFIDKTFAAHYHEEDDGKGKKKAPPKPKKGEHPVEFLATVSPGQELGKIAVLLPLLSTGDSDSIGSSVSKSPPSSHPSEWKAPLSIPNPSEHRRSMLLRLREHTPPPPAKAKGKGESEPENTGPAEELGSRLSLWHHEATPDARGSAWDRFPISNCIRYIDGVDVLTGLPLTSEGATEIFSKDELGVTSARVPPDADASLSFSFNPVTLKQSDEGLTILADFRLDSSASAHRVNESGTVEIPLLSLRNTVAGLEGRSCLELVFLRPSSAALVPEQKEIEGGESEGQAPAVELWTGCQWELRLCEETATECTETVSEEDAPGPVNDASVSVNKTVICRWSDGASFDSLAWHSVALSIQSSAPCGEENSEVSRSTVELTVDGTGRMKVDGGVKSEEGVAAAWLPPPRSKDQQRTDETHQEEESVGMVLRVGAGAGFSGRVKSLVLVSGKQGNAQDMTAAFAQQTATESDPVSSSSDCAEKEDEVDGDSPAVQVPKNCSVIQEVEIVVCGGRGCVDGLVIPSDTPAGTYVLEILDNVDIQCLSTEAVPPRGSGDASASNDPASELEVAGSVASCLTQLLPAELVPLCALAPPAGSSLASFKISVLSE